MTGKIPRCSSTPSFATGLRVRVRKRDSKSPSVPGSGTNPVQHFGTETDLSHQGVLCNIKHLKATNPGFLSGEVVKRTMDVQSPTFLYAAADQISDFGNLPASFGVRVAQVSQRYGPGRVQESVFTV
jgi:hypothetical protein